MSAVEEDDTVDNVLERATSSNASETASTTETSLVDDAASDDLLSDVDTGLMEHEDHGETHDEHVPAAGHGGADPVSTTDGGASGDGSGGPIVPATAPTTSGVPGPATSGGTVTTSASLPVMATSATSGTPAAVGSVTALATASATPGDGIPAAVIHHIATGVAAGDGDMMPARFAGDRKTSVGEWIRDFRDYIAIRKLPDDTARLVFRGRLTDVARQWYNRQPPDLALPELLSRLRARFGDTDAVRDRLTTEFFRRQQRADEPTETYIEGMASMARRIQLDAPHLVRQTILNGLRPAIQMNVKLQRPVTIEDIAAAAAIAETAPGAVTQPEPPASAAATTGGTTTTTTPPASVIDLVAAMRELLAAHTQPTATTTTTTTTASAASATSAPTAPPTPIIQMVMPAPYGGSGRGGRFGRGRGRGWRGPGHGRPGTATNAEPRPQLDPAASTFQPARASTVTRGPNDASDAQQQPTCRQCGRNHGDGECDAVNAYCYNCWARGHFARCCFSRTQQRGGPTTPNGVWGVKGDSGGLHAFVNGCIEGQSAQMLCDTGAFCNCISLKLYNSILPRMTSHKLHPNSQNFSAANNSPLDVAGSTRLSVKLGGRTIRETFFVVDGLSQNVILGIGLHATMSRGTRLLQ